MENAFDIQELFDVPGGIFDFDIELDSSFASHSENTLALGTSFQSLDLSDAKDNRQATVDATMDDGNDFTTSFQSSLFTEAPWSRFTELVEDLPPNGSALISSSVSDIAVELPMPSTDSGTVASLTTPLPAAMPASLSDVNAVRESVTSSSGALVQKKKRCFPVASKLTELELGLIVTNGKRETIHLEDAVTYVAHSVGNETARYLRISSMVLTWIVHLYIRVVTLRVLSYAKLRCAMHQASWTKSCISVVSLPSNTNCDRCHH
jgi:hypothetical protein